MTAVLIFGACVVGYLFWKCYDMGDAHGYARCERHRDLMADMERNTNVLRRIGDEARQRKSREERDDHEAPNEEAIRL